MICKGIDSPTEEWMHKKHYTNIAYLKDKYSEDDKACDMEHKCRVDAHPSITWIAQYNN